MKVVQILALIAFVLLFVNAANAGVSTIRQTLDYTSNGDFDEPWFLPADTIADHSPWHRGMWEDWGWMHDVRDRVPSDARSLRSATVTINAWDVDANDPEGPEIDVIYANEVRLGTLEGTDGRTWKTTTFELPEEVLDELWRDGQVYIFMDIDEERDMVGHRVTLDYATLTVEYNVSGKGTPSELAVHRFYSEALSTFFYTADESEKDKLIDDASDAWTYQGVAFHVPPADSEPNSAPVYRFWSPVLRTHFYTISEKERDKLIETFDSRWTYEGVTFWAFPREQQIPGTIPLYRFWSPTIQRHFYTTSEEQKEEIIRENSDVWVYEQIAWYIYR